MEPISFFLDESETLKFGPFSPGWRTRVDGLEKRAGLLNCIKNDLSNTLLLIAGCASLSNFAAEQPKFERRARQQIEQHMPTKLLSVSALLAELTGDRELLSICSTLLRLQSKIEVARVASSTRAVDHEVTWAIDELATLWGELCVSTLDVLQQINSLEMVSDPNQHSNDEISVERIAVAAGCGGWPCVEDDGILRVPGWIERRSNRRARANATWQLLANEISHEVKLRDLSSRGAGIQDAPELRRGQCVDLLQGSSGAMKAEVVWQVGSRCGLRFQQPLPVSTVQRILENT